MSDEELLKDIMSKENDGDDIETDDCDQPGPVRPRANELLEAIETLQNFALFIENGKEAQQHLHR